MFVVCTQAYWDVGSLMLDNTNDGPCNLIVDGNHETIDK